MRARQRIFATGTRGPRHGCAACEAADARIGFGLSPMGLRWRGLAHACSSQGLPLALRLAQATPL